MKHTIGFIGWAPSTRKNVEVLVNDYIDAFDLEHPDAEINVIVGLDIVEGEISPTMAHVLGWLLDEEIEFSLILDSEINQKTAKGVLHDALKAAGKNVRAVANVAAALAREVDVLFVALERGDASEEEYSPEAEELGVSAMVAADAAEVVGRDLADGLIEITFDGGQPEYSAAEPGTIDAKDAEIKALAIDAENVEPGVIDGTRLAGDDTWEIKPVLVGPANDKRWLVLRSGEPVKEPFKVAGDAKTLIESYGGPKITLKRGEEAVPYTDYVPDKKEDHLEKYAEQRDAINAAIDKATAEGKWGPTTVDESGEVVEPSTPLEPYSDAWTDDLAQRIADRLYPLLKRNPGRPRKDGSSAQPRVKGDEENGE